MLTKTRILKQLVGHLTLYESTVWQDLKIKSGISFRYPQSHLSLKITFSFVRKIHG